MEASPNYFDPRALAELEGLELRARHVVEGYVSGMHRSPLQGQSVEFAQHRQYTPGDDLRYVDWKAFARTDKFYLKQYEEETNLGVFFVLDISSSMSYKSEKSALSKLDYARATAGALAHLTIAQQDAAGLATFDTDVRGLVPESNNPLHLKQIFHEMERVSTLEKTGVGPVLHSLAERLPHRGLVVLLSDLFDDVESLRGGLQHLRHRRHDVIVFHVLDYAEIEFPFRESTLFQGLEGEDDLLTDPRSLRKAYLEAFNNYRAQVERICQSEMIDYQLLRTDASLGLGLSRFLAGRNIRLKY